MKPVFTRTFFRFLLSFLAIIAVACAVLVISSVQASMSPATVLQSILPFFSK